MYKKLLVTKSRKNKKLITNTIKNNKQNGNELKVQTSTAEIHIFNKNW